MFNVYRICIKVLGKDSDGDYMTCVNVFNVVELSMLHTAKVISIRYVLTVKNISVLKC